MNALNGLDGKSVVVGGALVVGAIALASGGLFPVLLVGGIAYFIGMKKGWWGHDHWQGRSELMRHGPSGAPPFFAEWHRQAHAADGTAQAHAEPGRPTAPASAWTPSPTPQAPAWPPAPAPEHGPASTAQPQDVEVRIPVTSAPSGPAASPEPPAPEAPVVEADYRRTVGENASPLA